MKKKNILLLKKISAIFTIYLILSLTFFTAKAFAVLNYEISGEDNVLGFARQDNDVITINTESDSDVSFIKNGNSVPLTCTSDQGVTYCTKNFPSGDAFGELEFTLQQPVGTPSTKDGVLYIDSLAPVPAVEDTPLIVEQINGGLNFIYDFKDYLSDVNEAECIGSGIGSVELIVNGQSEFKEIFLEEQCSLSGNYFKSFSGTNTNQVTYRMIVKDRVGNTYTTNSITQESDFTGPIIANTFKIMNGEIELVKLSQTAGITADIVIEIEDNYLDLNNVYADLSELNHELGEVYNNIKAVCTSDGSSIVYTCKFTGIQLYPESNNLDIIVTTTDTNGNTATKTVNKIIELITDRSQVTYIGPLKNHCTNDLTKCYLKSGRQVLTAELDDKSSYEHSVVYLGANDKINFAVCKLNDIWKCFGTYDVVENENSINVFLAESYDDYGNLLESDITRTILIDNILPINISGVNATNNNDNNGCALSGDELTLQVIVSENTIDPKIYVNTSKFTTQDIQKETCTLLDNGNWDCTLIIKDFISTAISANEQIIIEDLAGNKILIPYTFEVCQISTGATPNVIFGVTQKFTPSIDRRTASITPVKIYIPLEINVKSGAQIVYLSIDRCIGFDTNNMDVMGSGQYFIPTSGSSVTLVTNIGGPGKMLPETELKFNCTISAKIRQGTNVFVQPEKETITLIAKTFNQPLGSLDATTLNEIKTQKETLRDMDKEITKREKWDKILGTVCKISNILVKINSVLQLLKSLVYLVALVLKAIPVTSAFADTLWKGVDKATSGIDKFVQTFVWPTGKDPKAAIGYAWKYTCLIYNCKFYTLSGLIEIGSDAVQGYKAIEANNANKIESTSTDPNTGVTTNVYRDGSTEKVETYANGDIVNVRTYQDGVEVSNTRYPPDASGNYVVETAKSYPDSVDVPDDYYDNPDPNSEILDFNTENTYNSDGKLISSIEEHYLQGSTIQVSAIETGYSSDGKIVSQISNSIVDGDEMRTTLITTAQGTTITEYRNGVLFNSYTSNSGTQNVNIPFLGINSGIKKTITTLTSKYESSDVQKSVEYSYKGKTFSDNTDSYAYASEQRQELLYSDIDREDWIINPYRSKHYDGLCAPATLYNLKKERQVRCMYVSCLQTSQITGLSNVVCKDVYRFNDCLYLTSAQYKLNKNIWNSIGKGLVNQAISASMGMALHITYNAVCKKYLNKMGSNNLVADGWYSVGCGVFGAALKWKEIVALFSSPGEVLKDLFNGNDLKDPSEINDYCLGGELYAEQT
ncbi:MAG: hypothetical protein ACP5N1_02350 [Candidatus Woesearchaeota archaeon]